jgi:hypothetical protein
MADQGAIGKPPTFQMMPNGYVYRFPGYAAASPQTTYRQDAIVSGYTRIEGVLTANIEVWLIWRPTMVPLARTYSDSVGAYSFTHQPGDTSNLCVVFKDPVGGTVYNDQIFALIAT